MIRLALLQTDSSHAEVYQDYAAQTDGVAITSLWGTDPVHTARIARPGVMVAERLEQAISNVDGIMICGRWGDTHKEVAERALDAAVPVYVDKPFTNSLAEADYLFGLYREAKTPIFSASPLRFAKEVEDVADRLSEDEIIGGMVAGLAQWPDFGPKGCEAYFYGIHAMELVTALFGLGLEISGIRTNSHILEARLTHPNGYDVNLCLLKEGSERYDAHVVGTKQTWNVSANPEGDFYKRTLDRVVTFVRTGIAPVDSQETLQNIRILDAIEAFRKTGN